MAPFGPYLHPTNWVFAQDLEVLAHHPARPAAFPSFLLYLIPLRHGLGGRPISTSKDCRQRSISHAQSYADPGLLSALKTSIWLAVDQLAGDVAPEAHPIDLPAKCLSHPGLAHTLQAASPKRPRPSSVTARLRWPGWPYASSHWISPPSAGSRSRD